MVTAAQQPELAGSGVLAVGASAGSGKTTRLTNAVVEALTASDGTAVPVASLVAVTFTKKAAAELVSRIRREVSRSHAVSPAGVGAARVGTVHAVCLGLVREFAMEAGLSPNLDVLPDDEGRLLREVLERELPVDLRDRMTALAERLQIRWDSRVRRHDWVTPIEDIMTLARSNRIGPESLDQMAERSLAGLMRLLPPDEVDGTSLDAVVSKELATALAELERIDDGQVNTAEAISRLRGAARHVDVADMPWNEWAQLGRLSPGKACKAAVSKLVAAASQYERHPRFRSDLHAYVSGAYTGARVGLERFADWKARRRVVDYVDMIDAALSLLSVDDVREELHARTRLVVVDEFQDTSPIQLALFVRLHRIAGRSVWVGDRKQCIFEYAGADPDLMDAALSWCRQAGGAVQQLGFNYRSRPELVDATNAVFKTAFAPHGVTESEVHVEAKRELPASVQRLPPFGLWLIEAKSNAAEADAIAAGVVRLLSRPQDTCVVDSETGSARPVRPGDIALLVATNDEAKAIAEALERAGVRSALPRDGLLATPEGTLLTSALELLHDPASTLAAATIEALLGFDGVPPDRWLTQLLVRRTSAEEGQVAPSSGAASEALRSIGSLRDRVKVLSPVELVDMVIARLDLPRLCSRWPNAAQRLGNVDAFRALTRDYEQGCRYEHDEASLAGLLRFLNSARTPALRRDEMRATDYQHVPTGADCVTVSTYHRAKGLEWPVVVLSSLDRARRRSAFEVSPESDQAVFDPNDPLGGRWIRYWPWPLGKTKNVPLADVAARSEEGRRVADNEARERIRLLYVGFTRARDHLILATRLGKSGPKAPWLDELADANGRPVLHLPNVEHEGQQIEITRPLEETLKVLTRVWRLSPDDNADSVSRPERTRWFSRPPKAEVAPGPSFWVAPSRATTEWSDCTDFEIGDVIRVGEGIAPGLELPSEEWPRLGTAVHAFFAADDVKGSTGARVAMASRMLDAAQLSGGVRAETLVDASDALWTFVRARWPGARVHREIPVTAPILDGPARRLRGSIDVAVETSTTFAVIDHKTFPGQGEAAWLSQAREHGAQVVAYIRALSTVLGPKTAGGWIHFAATGAMVEIVWRK
jgi:ATP-dependent helicase/nuclease subunit A